MLRDRIARALPFWDVSMPGFHSILGMHAFGLEETGDFVRAEASGRQGVELEPRDGWSQHRRRSGRATAEWPLLLPANAHTGATKVR
jgi:hypothetical protein